jgi:hypothetical protein
MFWKLVHFLIDLKTRAVAPFSPDARTFHNIYKLQKHVLIRHQSHLIIFMGNKNLRFWQIMPFKYISEEPFGICKFCIYIVYHYVLIRRHQVLPTGESQA